MMDGAMSHDGGHTLIVDHILAVPLLPLDDRLVDDVLLIVDGGGHVHVPPQQHVHKLASTSAHVHHVLCATHTQGGDQPIITNLNE
jgi:hypothetical protein